MVWPLSTAVGVGETYSYRERVARSSFRKGRGGGGLGMAVNFSDREEVFYVKKSNCAKSKCSLWNARIAIARIAIARQKKRLSTFDFNVLKIFYLIFLNKMCSTGTGYLRFRVLTRGIYRRRKKNIWNTSRLQHIFTVLDKNIGTLKGKPSVADPFHTFQFGPYSCPNNLLLFK